ncbi:MAG: helix-turn-helix domain-containing protein [Opitutales bacterium]
MSKTKYDEPLSEVETKAIRHDPPATMTHREVAAYLSMSPRWVRRQTALGLLPCRRLGNRARYSLQSINAFLTS